MCVSTLYIGIIVLINQLTFTSENWNVPQYINLSATNDDFALGPRLAYIGHQLLSNDPVYVHIDSLLDCTIFFFFFKLIP